MINVRIASVLVLSLPLFACGSKEGDKPSDSAKAASGSSASAKSNAAPLTPKVGEAKLKAAGFKVESPGTSDEDWQSAYWHLEKGSDDNTVRATVWLDALSETAHEGGPKPVITVGKDALVRVGWSPADPAAKKAAPDLAAIAKDIAAASPPEKITDDFFPMKLTDAAKKWKVENDGSRGGGRAAPSDVIFNYRYLNGDGGTLVIDSVQFGEAIKKGSAKMVGNTIVAVDCEDAPTAKKIYDVLTGG